MSEAHHVLLVANRTATTGSLRETVKRLAEPGVTSFHLLVPAVPQGLHRIVDPEVAGRQEAQVQLDAALPPLSEAAGSEVTGEVGSADPFAAIQDAIGSRRVDEVVISTLPKRMSRWLKVDLPSKTRGLGLPVTHVEARTAEAEHAA